MILKYHILLIALAGTYVGVASDNFELSLLSSVIAAASAFYIWWSSADEQKRNRIPENLYVAPVENHQTLEVASIETATFGEASEITDNEPAVEDNTSEPELSEIKPLVIDNVASFSTGRIRFIPSQESTGPMSELSFIDNAVQDLPPARKRRLILTRSQIASSQTRLQRLSLRASVQECIYRDLFPNTDMIACVDDSETLSPKVIEGLIQSEFRNYDEIIAVFPEDERAFWENLATAES